MPEETLNILRSTALFRHLEDKALEEVWRASQTSHLESGAFFFMEGEPAQKAYLLLAGKVKLVQVTADGQQVILEYLVPGRAFGIISILQNSTYPVSAQAVGSSRALGWDHESLSQLMGRYPRLAQNLMHIMATQIRQFQNTVRDLSTKRVEQRIARAVLRLARQSGRKVAAGVLIDLPLSRQDLAQMTGTTLYTVSRVFTEWESQNLVQSKRQQVIITNPHGLVRIAEDLPEDIPESSEPTAPTFFDL